MARKKELEESKRVLRAVEFKQTIEEKERVKMEERMRDFEFDKMQVQRAIRESEQLKRVEEEKRLKLRQQQSLFVEQSRIDKDAKERAKRAREQEEYQKTTVANPYFQRIDELERQKEERKRR